MEEKLQDTIDKLCLRLNRAKLPDGQKIALVQVTADKKLPVFLTKIGMQDGNYRERCIDSHGGEILQSDDFCNRVEETHKKEVRDNTKMDKEKKDIFELFEKLKREVAKSLDEGRELIEKEMLMKRPATEYLIRLRDGALDDQRKFLEETERLIREMKSDPFEILNSGKVNIEELKKLMKRTNESIKGLCNLSWCQPDMIADISEMMEKEMFQKTNFQEEKMLQRIQAKLSDKFSQEMTSKIGEITKKIVNKEEFAKDVEDSREIHQKKVLEPIFKKLQLNVSEAIPFFKKIVGHWVLNPRFELLYMGSIHGFEAASFHSKCDGKNPTLTIARNEHGRTFGGFTTLPWESSPTDKFHPDEHARVFSYDFKEVFGQVNHKEKAICFNKNCGPAFGSECNLAFQNNCNQNAESFMRENGTFFLNGRSRDTIAGSRNFRIIDYAVFLVKSF